MVAPSVHPLDGDAPREESRRVLARVLAFLGYPPEWLDAFERRELAAGRAWHERDDLLQTMRD